MKMKNRKNSDNSLHNVIKIKDEEKATNELCKKCSSYDFCNKNNQLHCAETVAYIKGLAEGRKDRNYANSSNHGNQFEVIKLEKENELNNETIKELLEDKVALANIIRDMMHYTDACDLCKKKGVDIPYCSYTCDEDCLNRLLELYRGK